MDDEATRLLVIPDGHRRYATLHGISDADAYCLGANAAARLVAHCLAEPSITALTIYPLAKKNFDERSACSLNEIMRALDSFITQLEPLTDAGLMVRFRGSLARIPPSISNSLLRLIDRCGDSTHGRRLTLELLVDYSGLDELRTLNSTAVAEQLSQPFDIVIRTGGHFRLSDAPVLQCHASDMVSVPMMFPDFTYADLCNAVRDVLEDRIRRDLLNVATRRRQQSHGVDFA